MDLIKHDTIVYIYPILTEDHFDSHQTQPTSEKSRLISKAKCRSQIFDSWTWLSFCSSKWEIHWSSRTFHNLPVFYMTSLFCASVSSLWRKTWDNEIRARKRVFWGLEWEILVYVHLVCCFVSVVTQCPMQAHRVLGHIWWCSGSRMRGRGWHEVSVSSSRKNLY